MSDLLRTAENRLITALSQSARGPKRNGLFAVWLLVRACDGLLPPTALTPRAHRRRMEGLERRLSSLSLAPTVRRLLHRCVRDLQPGQTDSALRVLHHLAVSLPELLGPEAAVALEAAVHAAGGTDAPLEGGHDR